MDQARNTLEAFALEYFPSLDGAGLRQVCRDTLAYLLKTADKDRSRRASTDLSDAIKHVAGDGVNTRDYRRDIYVHGYLLKNIKLWIWWTAARRLSPAAARRAMPGFGVRAEDWPLVPLALSDRRIKRSLVSMSRKYDAHTLTDFDGLVSRAIDAADRAIRSYAFRKLRFLERTRFITSDDLLSELRCHAVLSLTRQYPRIESDDHARNMVSMCIVQGANTIINEHTRKGSEFLVRNQDGTWDGLVFSYDQNDAGSVPVMDPLDASGAGQVSSDVDVSGRAAAGASEFIVSRYGGRKRRFATLMLGLENREFSEYLAGFGLPANHILFDEASASGDPDELERYVRHAASWLGVRFDSAWAFLMEMGRDLDG